MNKTASSWDKISARRFTMQQLITTSRRVWPDRATAIVGEAVFVAFLVGAKSARLTFDLPPCDEDGGRDDVAFTLLMVEALLRESRAIFEVAFGRGVDACGNSLALANSELRQQLDRHLRCVRKEDANALADLIRSGRAPCPFCVTTRATPASA